MYCWKCKNTIHFLGKISFRTICESCGSSLHACKQCKHYMEGKPSHCNIPDIEPVRDKEQANFCEDFEATQNRETEPQIRASDIEKRLFK